MPLATRSSLGARGSVGRTARMMSGRGRAAARSAIITGQWKAHQARGLAAKAVSRGGNAIAEGSARALQRAFTRETGYREGIILQAYRVDRAGVRMVKQGARRLAGSPLTIYAGGAAAVAGGGMLAAKGARHLTSKINSPKKTTGVKRSKMQAKQGKPNALRKGRQKQPKVTRRRRNFRERRDARGRFAGSY